MDPSQSATPPNVYIIGAASTGKTTLVNNLHSYFTRRLATPLRPAIITEVARTVLRQHNFTARDILLPARSLTLQRLILQAQAAAERDALGGDGGSGNPGRWFVSDRSGADPIAYATKYIGAEAARGLVESAEWADLKQRMVKAVVVICEAG